MKPWIKSEKKTFYSETFFDEAFLDMVGPCPFLGCSNTFRKKRKKTLMQRNALNEISKFSIMLTNIFDQKTLFFIFFIFFPNFCTKFVQIAIFLYAFFKNEKKINE